MKPSTVFPPERWMLKAAIFDLDGLLIDSEPLWQQAEIEGFGEVGLRLTREQAQETLGLRSAEVVKMRFDQYGWDAQRYPLERLESAIVDRVIELIRRQGRAKPGVDQTLDFLDRRGLRLAVASSSRRMIIEAALQKLGIAERFELTYSAESEPLGKPHPGVYLSTALSLGLRPAECIAFEDSPVGLQAAKAAGMICVVVPDPAAVGDARLQHADLLLSSLAEFGENNWRRILRRSAPGPCSK